MGPPWCGQGTVPHTTLSDLLPTDVIRSPPEPVGAGEVDIHTTRYYIAKNHEYIPADVVLVEEVTVLLTILVPNTAITLTLQLLLGAAGNI